MLKAENVRNFQIDDIVPPYDMDKMMNIYTKPSFPELVDIFKDGKYHRVLHFEGNPMLVIVNQIGTIEEPVLGVTLASPIELNNHFESLVKDKLVWMLGLHEDVKPFYEYVKDDPVLSELTVHLKGLRAPSTPSVFEGFVHAVIEQQISFAFAGKLIARIVERYGTTLEYKESVYHAFPKPEELANATIEDLREMQLSTRKSEYLIDVAKRISNGTLNLDQYKSLSVDEVEEQMTKIRGIGKWSAHMIMVRSMRKREAMPASDIALRRVIGQLYFDGTKASEEQVREIAERWGPHRAGYATFYLIFSANYL